MSLVNDLLLELDRQEEEAKRDPSHFLNGLAPQSRRKQRSGSRRFLSLFIIAATTAFLLAGLSILKQWSVADTTGVPDATAPAVSARPQPDFPIGLSRDPLPSEESSPHPASTEKAPTTGLPDVWIERSPTLSSVTLQRRQAFTRLRFETRGAVAHEIQPAEDARGLVLFLPSTTLSDPLTTLELEGTPIRSIATASESDGLRIALRFDDGLRIHSQSLETSSGSTLFVDLQPEAGNPRGVDSSLQRSQRSIPEPTAAAPAATTKIATPRWGSEAEPGAEEAPPSRDALAISRSAGDRKRADRITAHELASREVDSARLARSEGDLDEADRRYAAAIGFLPDHRQAIVEWASLLGELSRFDEAIDLIRGARRADSKDPALAMLHAHLLETNARRDEAIELLDHAGFSLTEAPDIHALAAAYLQRAGEHDRAIERYETIVRRYPGKAQWWMGLGISLEAKERLAEAADVYRIAMQIGDLPQQTRHWVDGRIEALGEGD